MTAHSNSFFHFINQIPDPVVIVDSKGRFLAINDEVEKKTGFKKEDLLGRNFLGEPRPTGSTGNDVRRKICQF